MAFLVLQTFLADKKVNPTLLDANLYVFKSGDFLVLPKTQGMNFQKQLRLAKREKIAFNFKWCRLSNIPFTKTYCFLSVLLAWVVRRKWRLTPSRATALRQVLVNKGFSLIYTKDDLYRVVFFRSHTFKLKFWRRIPAAQFIQADYSRLNHTRFGGIDIFFSPFS